MKKKFRLTFQEWLGKTMAEYRLEATARGRRFTLTMTELCDTITASRCAWCGRLPNRTYATSNAGVVAYLKLALKDNGGDYTAENVRGACPQCCIRIIRLERLIESLTKS